MLFRTRRIRKVLERGEVVGYRAALVEMMIQELSGQRREAYELVVKTPKLSSLELAQEMNLKVSHAANLLRGLFDLGLLWREREGKRYVYSAVEDISRIISRDE